MVRKFIIVAAWHHCGGKRSPLYTPQYRLPAIPPDADFGLEVRAGGRHDKVADADRLRELPAEEHDSGELLGGHELRVAEQRTILLKADAHCGVDVRLYIA